LGNHEVNGLLAPQLGQLPLYHPQPGLTHHITDVQNVH
jgi:hypothetical protein